MVEMGHDHGQDNGAQEKEAFHNTTYVEFEDPVKRTKITIKSHHSPIQWFGSPIAKEITHTYPQTDKNHAQKSPLTYTIV